MGRKTIILDSCRFGNLFCLREDDGFQVWKDEFDSYLDVMVSQLQSDYLDALGLSISINPEYKFVRGRSMWLASYERRSGKIYHNVISIGINYPLLYSEMCKRGIEKDWFNICAQARITVGHEIGHGLVDYLRILKNSDDFDISSLPNVCEVVSCHGDDEEDVVEEFGRFQFERATGVIYSLLDSACRELASYLKKGGSLSCLGEGHQFSYTTRLASSTYKPSPPSDIN